MIHQASTSFLNFICYLNVNQPFDRCQYHQGELEHLVLLHYLIHFLYLLLRSDYFSHAMTCLNFVQRMIFQIMLHSM